MPGTTQDTSNMQPVPPSMILPGSKGQFELYLQRGNEYVLYTSRGEQFLPEHRQRLLDQGIEHVYVPMRQKAGLEEYLRSNLGAMLGDRDIPVNERAGAWNLVAGNLTRDLFEEQLPAATAVKRLNRMMRIIESSKDFFTNPEALRELAILVSKGHGLLDHCLGTMVFSTTLLQTFEHKPQLTGSCAIGALLHDLGKTRLPGHVLDLAPDAMVDKERRLLESHPGLAVSLTAPLSLTPESLHCILFHHERMDGGGYPSHLPGEAVPMHAQVVALCNRYDGLTRTNQHRPARSPFDALRIIKDDAGFASPSLFKRLVQVLSDANIT